MALKCIEFTDGTKLVVFANASQTVWNDTIYISPNEVQNYSQVNAFVTAGNPSGGFVNENLNGKSLTDKDGNVWTFTKTGAGTMRCSIAKHDGTYYNKDLNRTYSGNSNCWMWYLVCTDIDTDGNYGLVWGSRRAINGSSRQTSGSTRYIRCGYVNGVNGNYNFADDVALVKPEDGYTSCALRNAIPGSPFVSLVGIRSGHTNNTIIETIARDYFTEPYGSGTQESTPFLYLSSSSVDDYSETPPDPYDPGGGSGTGGGTGDFDGTGDDIDIPGLPTLSATDTGFITLFNPSTGQLQSLANYMWSSGFDLDTFKKLFADPMDCILGLSIVPVAVPNGGSKAVSVGNISTGVTMTVAASQYVEVDCGTLNVNEFWGAYLDYDPYTKAEIYLPYIGTHPLAVDDIMGKAVHVVYHIDILSGACTAFVKCGGSVLYEFIGQCSSSIPITGNDWTNVINGVISIAGAIGSMVATGGASAPMAAGMIAATATNSMKPNVEKSGSMSGTGGMLAVQVPYLILTRPRQALPSGQNSFMGYPSFITESLGSLHGYTEIESVHLDGVPATEQEISEIESLLKTGVIF